MKNSLSYVIFCWFIASTTHQLMIFMFLVTTKSSEINVNPQSIHGELKKIRYLNFSRRRIVPMYLTSLEIHFWRGRIGLVWTKIRHLKRNMFLHYIKKLKTIILGLHLQYFSWKANPEIFSSDTINIFTAFVCFFSEYGVVHVCYHIFVYLVSSKS